MKSSTDKRRQRPKFYRMAMYDVLDPDEPVEYFGPRLTEAEAMSPAVHRVVQKLNNSLCIDDRLVRLCGIFPIAFKKRGS